MTLTICDKITRWSIYVAFLLVPVFFLPVTIFPLALDKQVLLLALMFIGLIAWLAGGIIQGKLIMPRAHINYLVLALIVFSAASAWFSGARGAGFWGTTGGEVNTFVNLLAFGLLFFLTASVFKQDGERKVLISLTLVSAAAVLIYSVLQMLGIWILPWQFTQRAVFNPIGTTNALAIYLGAAFALAFSLFYLPPGAFYKRITAKIALIGLALALFITGFFINFWVVFAGWLAITFLLLLISFKSVPAAFSAKKTIPALAVLIISLLVVLVRFNVFSVPLPTFNLPGEVVPSVGASWQIAKSTLGEGLKNILLGSGPATYQYKYAFYKSAALNSTPFWSTNFIQGFSALFTHLVEGGILGVVLWLSFLVSAAIAGLKLIKELSLKKKNDDGRIILGSVLLAFIYLLITLFLYSQNFTNYFLIFSLAGIITGAAVARDGDYWTIHLNNASRRVLIVSLFAIGIFLLMSVVIYSRGRHYWGAAQFKKGMAAADSQQIDKVLSYLLAARSLDSRNDFYLRALSDAYLLKIKELVSQPATDKPADQREIQKKFVDNLREAINAAQVAIAVNGVSGANWMNLAGVYENVIGLVDGAAEQSYQAYQKAIELEPTNPLIYGNLGRAYLTAGKQELAIEKLKKAIGLKADYAPAYYWLGVAYRQSGDKNEALKQLEIARQLSPDDSNVQRLIDELKEEKKEVDKK